MLAFPGAGLDGRPLPGSRARESDDEALSASKAANYLRDRTSIWVSLYEVCTIWVYTIEMETIVDRVVTACPAERAVRAVEGRWKIFIIYYLLERTMRFAELQRAINARQSRAITAKMLTQELREMETDGLLHREVYPQVPPKVEYSLTENGQKLRPVVEAMSAWGQEIGARPHGR
jgi:DNA-binding HxlR family transcriptional regulator